MDGARGANGRGRIGQSSRIYESAEELLLRSGLATNRDGLGARPYWIRFVDLTAGGDLSNSCWDMRRSYAWILCATLPPLALGGDR